MDWITCTKSFVTVIQHGSLSQAAKHLEISNSALSKRLSWLEQQLGVQLLKRTTRHLSMTEAGDTFFQRSLMLLDQWQQLLTETTATNSDIHGNLRIGSSLTAGDQFLIQAITTFSHLYPKVNIALHSATFGQLPDLNLDIIISPKIDDFNSASYIATPLFETQARFYASPDYLEQHDPLLLPEQLSQHNCLLLGSNHHQQDYVFDNGSVLRLQGNFLTANPAALLASAEAGMGLILTSPDHVQHALNSGLLIPVLPQLTLPKQTIFAYYPKLHYQHEKTKRFIDVIKQSTNNTSPKSSI
ncbi:LysR family transcriptional regulator [Photobacterium lucens]|uniref:LysR family transcriptional regulator n=1 Tax=Photobacterium lucens TaxID=2562949 RepID=UPI00136946C1|nr:LysR family transcriptional regulator [Photobacterium lucens]MBP2700500.1 LysR family transcriptional regulator [Vibrio parahaemolyticus]MZG56124.1 LysR family transcriptional regulator [Photobacterium lucens]MZG82981.1 LysR family transcriptional regulator [Photobacterium lucens]